MNRLSKLLGVMLVMVVVSSFSLHGLGQSFFTSITDAPDAIAAATGGGSSGGGSGNGGSTPIKPKPVPVPVPKPVPITPAPVVPVAPVETQPDMMAYTMILDNQEVPVDGIPIYRNTSNGPLVHLRSLAKALGYQVGWDPSNRKVHLENREKSVDLSPENLQATVSGKPVILPEAPVIRVGSTFLTFSAIKELFQCDASVSDNRLVLQPIKTYTSEGEIIQQESYLDGLIIRVFGNLTDTGQEDTVFITVSSGVRITDESGQILSLADVTVGKTVVVVYQGSGSKNELFVGKAISIVVKPARAPSSGGSNGVPSYDDGGSDESEDEDD